MVADANTAAVEDKARLVSAVLGLPCHRSARRERSRRGTWMDGRGHGLDDLGCPADGLGAGRARGHAGVTVRHCRVTRSEAHGVDQWRVMEVGDGTTGDDGIDRLNSLFGHFSLSSASSTTSPPGDKTFTLPLIADRVIVTEEANKIGLVRPSVTLFTLLTFEPSDR